jgi:hypothetical protein
MPLCFVEQLESRVLFGAHPLTDGVLRVDPQNPRYFEDGQGQIVYLTGSHTWGDVQDTGHSLPIPKFNFKAYANWVRAHNGNYIRLWHDESARWAPNRNDFWIDPLPYQRTGPGTALDGGPKWDLTKFNQAFFDRLRQRAIMAGQKGIYVSVQLFQGWSIENKGLAGTPWKGHPMNAANNINGINGDRNGNGQGEEVHTLANPAVSAIEEAYVRKVIDTVGNLDNVMYEISNESPASPANTAWQYHFINFIKNYEKSRGLQHHPVIMSWPWGPPQNNNKLFKSPADAISPGWGGFFNDSTQDYRSNPPVGTGQKVIISDTDHLWGVGGNAAWVWKSFARGLNPTFMDPYTGPNDGYEGIRKNMGYTRDYALRMNLAKMTPRTDVSSTRYALANMGNEYLIYQPGSGAFTVNLGRTSRTYQVEWLNPATGAKTAGRAVTGRGNVSFSAPFNGQAVLYLKRLAGK